MNIYKVAEAERTLAEVEAESKLAEAESKLTVAKRKLAEVEAKRKQGRKIIISCSFVIFIVLILSFSVYCHRMLII